MRKVVILGLTGSIGTTALRGCKLFEDSIRIIGASCHSKINEALQICAKNNIPNLCITGPESSYWAKAQKNIKIWTNISEMLSFILPHTVLNGIAGSAGLKASFDAIGHCKNLALANKESVVLGGKILFQYAKEKGTKIIPVDSEHSAIDELLQAHKKENVSKIIITASGGPFRNKEADELKDITPQQAIKHPTWNMGPKISIDSSTLANKGLEVIEAHYLFGFDAKDIEVVIHPQSIVHSMIRTANGQVYAQMSPPDMVFPIMRALTASMPSTNIKSAGKMLDFTSLDLSFSKLDENKFPFVKDAFECITKEGSYPIAYNASNEIAVQAFIDNKINYTSIRDVVREVLDCSWSYSPKNYDEIEKQQERAFEKARSIVNKGKCKT